MCTAIFIKTTKLNNLIMYERCYFIECVNNLNVISSFAFKHAKSML